jgi:hypothetical protein
MKAARPRAFTVAVFPPVFGPVHVSCIDYSTRLARATRPRVFMEAVVAPLVSGHDKAETFCTGGVLMCVTAVKCTHTSPYLQFFAFQQTCP